MDQYPPLTLAVHDEPTMFNKEMAIGTFFGPIGMLIGGWIGKSRMSNELKYGKVVGEPSGWNKDAALGFLGGNLLGGIVAAIMVAGGAVAGIAALLPLAAGVAGGFMGAHHGEAAEFAEYQKAATIHSVAQAQEHAKGLTHEPGLEQEIESTKYRDLVTAQQSEHHR